MYQKLGDQCTYLGNIGSVLLLEPTEEDQGLSGIYDHEYKKR